MASRITYKTRQREILLEYLSSRQGEHITAGDVCDYLKEQGSGIGQATVYRQLEKLVEEGVLAKYNVGAATPACFEYLGEEHSAEKGTCYHCKCEKCGKLIHLHCEELEELQEHFRKEHGFRMDSRRTVFYGVCDDCMSDET